MRSRRHFHPGRLAGPTRDVLVEIAGHEAVRPYLAEGRVGGRADVHRMRAAWVERAAGLAVQQRRRQARNTAELALLLDRGQALDQQPRVGVEWIAEDLRYRRHLGHLAGI